MMPSHRSTICRRKNQMNAFARMTGGRSYAPRLMGEMPDIFREVAQVHPQPVHHHLQAHQQQAGRHLSQAEGGTGWTQTTSP